MADGDDLPDWDYGSIYGEKALASRQAAKYRVWLAEINQLVAQQRQLQALLDALDENRS